MTSIKLSESHRWHEQDNVIYFNVTSDGTTGPQWIPRLEQRGSRLSKYAKDVLNSPDFTPTNDVKYHVAVLKGMFFKDRDRITSKIRAEAKRRKWLDPHPEVACLIREMFSDEELEAMGLEWIVTMHEPIEDSDGDPGLLDAGRHGDGRRLNTSYDGPDVKWGRGSGFAFVVPHASSGN